MIVPLSIPKFDQDVSELKIKQKLYDSNVFICNQIFVYLFVCVCVS